MYISISYICIFRLGVYEVYCVPCYILFVYFFVGSGFLWVGILIVYTEIPRVFWALGILFIYLLWCWRGILDLLGSEVYPVGMGLSLGCYTGLGT